jgi:hypothetical protein
MIWTLFLALTTVATPPSEPPAISQLQWLTGCWASEGRDAGSGECWLAPAGGTMFGASRTVRGDRTVAFEHLSIREVAPGVLAYVAVPSGQAETHFPVVEISADHVVFENPEHDFPQRVIYRKIGEDRIQARIEGSIEGRERSVDFPMTKATDFLGAALRD